MLSTLLEEKELFGLHLLTIWKMESNTKINHKLFFKLVILLGGAYMVGQACNLLALKEQRREDCAKQKFRLIYKYSFSVLVQTPVREGDIIHVST